MDPTEAAKFIIEALREDDVPQAGMALEELVEWLRKGGFAPKSEVLADLLRELTILIGRLHRSADR